MRRHEILNHFIQSRGYTSFLEIGTYQGDTYRNVSCTIRLSVDPDPNTPATHHMTSDAFFASCKDKFDIIFIDGLHEHNQVWRDIQNGLKHINKNGVIVMHDCHPTTEKMQEYHTESQYGFWWTGDVWKSFVKARATLPYELYVFDNDMGCGIIDTTLQRTSDVSQLPTDMEQMTYEDFVNHPEWMNFTTSFLEKE